MLYVISNETLWRFTR